MGLKVFCIDGVEFWAHYSLEECKKLYQDQTGENPDNYEWQEISEDRLDSLYVLIEDENEKPNFQRTFREEIAFQDQPCFIASSEY